MENALTELLKHGVLGVLLVVTLVWIYRLHNENKQLHEQYKADLIEVQEKRTDDAKMVVDKLLSINDKWNAALSDHLRMMEVMEPALREIKTILLQAQMDRASGRK